MYSNTMAIQKLYFYNFTVSKLLKGDHTVADIARTNMYTVQNAASQNLTFTLWSQENFPFGLLKPSIRNTQAVATQFKKGRSCGNGGMLSLVSMQFLATTLRQVTYSRCNLEKSQLSAVHEQPSIKCTLINSIIIGVGICWDRIFL